MGTSEAWISRNLGAIVIAYLTVGIGLTVALLLGAQREPLALFKRSEFVSPQTEMTDEQRQKIAFFSPPNFNAKELTLVRMNLMAFMGREVKVEMPDGKDYTFTGGLSRVGVGSQPPLGGAVELLCWSGQIGQVFPGGVVAYSGSGHVCFERDFVSGEFSVGGKYFDLTDNGDHQILREGNASKGWLGCGTRAEPA